MISAFFLYGILTAAGVAALRACEGRSPVLAPGERVAAGFLVGTAGGMFLLWLALLTGLPLTRMTVAVFLLLLAVAAAALLLRQRSLAWRLADEDREPLPAWLTVLGVLTALKVIALTVSFALTPAYLDDTLSNWNMRAKVFFHTQSFTVRLPEGINGELSSYPPPLSLLKASAAALHGSWSEPLANGVQILWYAALLALLYGALRRWLPRTWAWVGTYAFVSLPLPLLHGVNAYADTLLSAHVFAAVAFTVAAMRGDGDTRTTLLRCAALMGTLLTFTKNEGLLIYGALFALLWLWAALQSDRPKKTIITGAGLALAVLLPWLAFKWGHGLTFGNAKSVTGLTLGFEPQVFYAVAVHMFFEGNWNLLWSVVVAMLLLERRTAWAWPVRLLTLFCIAAFAAQVFIYVCTPLATEALRQTGFGRGIVHITPLAVWLTMILLYARRQRV